MSVKQMSICFVCLCEVESIHNNENESEFDLYFFVQFAKYYLKIPSISINLLLSENGNKLFCGTCVKVVSNISNLYLEVVQIQHRLSWRLSELEKMIENSETFVSQKERVRELADNLGIGDAAEVETIRKLLRVNCERMSQKFQPQLVLKGDEALLTSFSDSVNTRSDQIVKKEVEYSPENSDDNWNSLVDNDEVVFDADAMVSSRTQYEATLMESPIKVEEDGDKNSDSEDGADAVCESSSASGGSSSSEEDDVRGRPAFTARKVGKNFPAKLQLPKKLATATKVSLVSCEVAGCPEQFKSHLQLNPHLETHSESINFCKVCGFGYIDMNLLKLHSLTHLKPVKKDGMARGKYHCPEVGCSFQNTALSRLQDHYNSRHGVSLKRCKCGQCDYVGVSLKSLQYHVRQKHIEKSITAKKPQQCIPCGLQFNNRRALVRHRSRFHGRIENSKIEELQFHCLTCTKAFPTVAKLELHKTSRHGEKVHECEICKKLFRTSDLVKNHRKKIHNFKMCPHCGITLGRQAMTTHILKTHIEKAATDDGPYGCPHCSLRYSRKAFMYRHIYKEHPDAPENLMCSQCGLKKEGGRENVMKRHELTHLTEEERKRQRRETICHICGREFATLTAFSNHAATHEEIE